MTRITLPPYPNGWFAVAQSHELEKGQVKPVKALGHELAVFRDSSGAARVIDAFCPHLGAHLGHGGMVNGNAIRCPFHGWKFDGATGDCVEIPYAKKIPAKACVRTWPVIERNKLVFVYHHEEDVAPDWEPELIPELESPDHIFWGAKEWILPTHPQEIMENGVDWAHFETLHGWKVAEMDWEANGPFYRLKIHVDTGADEQAATAANSTDVDSFNSGPGFLYTRAVELMTGIVTNCLTPIEPEKLRLWHLYYYHKDCDPAVYNGFFEAYVNDWLLDIPIWSHKIYRDRPVLCDGDGPHFGRFRKWYKQFYSEDVATGLEESGARS